MRQLVLSLAAGIAVFLVLALALRWNFLLSAALGVGIYFAFWFLLAPKPDKFTLYFTDQQDAQEMQDLMAEAERDLFRRLVARNARNMSFESYDIRFVDEADVETAVKEITERWNEK